MLQSAIEYYRVLQSIAKYYRVLQNIIEYYRVFLAHLLGQIFGLVFVNLTHCQGARVFVGVQDAEIEDYEPGREVGTTPILKICSSFQLILSSQVNLGFRLGGLVLGL